MANPFLVLGGIAISVITAAVGVLAVPGWVASAQDAAAINDIANIRDAQEIALAETGTYAAAGDLIQAASNGFPVSAPLAADTATGYSGDMGVALSGGVSLVGIVGSSEGWCGVVQSASGRYFAGSHALTTAGDGEKVVPAVIDANCTPTQASAIAVMAGETYVPGGDPAPEPELGSDPGYQPYDAMFTLRCDVDTSVRLPTTGVTGTVTWSDGTTSTEETLTGGQPGYKTLTAGVEYTAIIDGTFTGFGTGQGLACFRSMDSWSDESGTTSAANAFKGMTNLTSVPANLPPTVTNLTSTFEGATSFNDADVAKWDVSNVTTLNWMFKGANAFQQDIEGWTFRALTHVFAQQVFADTTGYTGSLDGWTFENRGLVQLTNFFSKSPFGGSMDNWTFRNEGLVDFTLQIGDSVDGQGASVSGWSFSGPVPTVSFRELLSGANSLAADDWTFEHAGPMSYERLVTAATEAQFTARRWTFRNTDALGSSSVPLFDGSGYITADLSDWAFENNGNVLFKIRDQFNTKGSFNLSGWRFDNTGNVTSATGGIAGYAEGTVNADDWVFSTGGNVKVAGLFAGASSSDPSPAVVEARRWVFENGGTVNISQLFSYNPTFNSDITGWVFNSGGNITADWMLSGATGFDRDLSGWDVSKFTSHTGFAPDLRAEYQPAFS